MPFTRPSFPRGHLAAWALLALVAVPLLWSLWGAVLAGVDAAAWADLRHDSQAPSALAMSLWTGVASSTLAVATAAWVLSWCVG
jgi:putative thiamine transport system permease protein